ncbi:portal protein [Vibrio phage D518]
MLEEQKDTSNTDVSAKESLTDWSNEPTVGDLNNDFTMAKSSHDSQAAKIGLWLDNLHITGSAKKKFPKGKSQVQPQLIRKQAEWRYASLSDPLLSTYDLFDVNPVTAEDKDSAYQNQLLLNYQFNCKIDKQNFVDEYVRTCVNEGTVVLRTGWLEQEEEVTRSVPTYAYTPTSDPAAVALIINGMALKEQSPAEFKVLPDDLRASIEYSLKNNNIPHLAKKTGSKRVTETMTTKNHPTVEVCDYRNVYIDPTCNGDFDKAQFVIYSFETSLSELKAAGQYENLDYLEKHPADGSVLSRADHEVDEKEENFQFQDAPRKKLIAKEYWGYWDIDGDGEVEPIVATWVGNTMIRLEENPFPDRKIPFVVVPYLPVKFDVYGEPDGSLLKENQDIIGAVTRGMIDIMARSANGQIGMRKDALDAPNKRKFELGKDYEFNPTVDPARAIINHTYPEIPQSAAYMLDMQNQDAESLTGVKAFASGITGNALGDTATGVRGAMDAASKRELGILRRLADGLVKVGRKFLAMNSEFLSEEEVVRVTNKEFVDIRRDDLAGNFDLRLTVSTAEEDNAKAQELAFMLQTMGNNLPFEMTQLILSDITRLRKMPVLTESITNYQPKPDPMQQLEAAKIQAEIAKIQSETNENYANAQLDQAKAQSEVAKAQNISADTDRKALDYVEQESGVNHARDVDKMQAQAEAQTNMKIVEAALQPKPTTTSTDS